MSSIFINNPTVYASGECRLTPVTKQEVQNKILNEGVFKGFVAGNKIPPEKVAGGWNLGKEVIFHNINQLHVADNYVRAGLAEIIPEHGTQPVYYADIQKESLIYSSNFH